MGIIIYKLNTFKNQNHLFHFSFFKQLTLLNLSSFLHLIPVIIYFLLKFPRLFITIFITFKLFIPLYFHVLFYHAQIIISNLISNA